MNEKYNILFALPEFVTEEKAGGLATYYDNISRILADHGNIITIFVLSETNEIFAYYPNVTVYRIKVDQANADCNIPGSLMRLWSRRINEAIREFREEGNKIDIIQYASYLGFGLDRLDDVPTVVRVSSYQPLMRAAIKPSFDINKKYECERPADFIEALSTIMADAVYSPSQIMISNYERETGKKISCIESPFYPLERREGYQDDHPFNGRKYILTFGTLSILKGTKLIGDIIYEVLVNNKEVCWLFAGAELPWIDQHGIEVPPSQYIYHKAREYKNRTAYLGKIEHSYLLEIIEKASLCVFPSRIDNLPNTCIEAMALGKVVVGTRGASFEQLIVDGENGYLVEREDGRALINVINTALHMDEDEKTKMGKKAKERIENIGPERIKDELMRLYDKTIKDFSGEPEYYHNTFYNAFKDRYNVFIEKYDTAYRL